MKLFFRAFLILIPILILGGCSAYKELKPDPPLNNVERGYIELKDDDDFFEISEGKKYFIKFPKAPDVNFYLVLKTGAKKSVKSILSTQFKQEDLPFIEVKDDGGKDDTVFVFQVDSTIANYYWIITDVPKDMILYMDYRYVPVWRYTFEQYYNEYNTTLANNKVSRAIYQGLDMNYDLSVIDYGRFLSEVNSKESRLIELKDKLQKLSSVFPKNMSNSDTAYQSYQKLNTEVEDELDFQAKYRDVLTVFEKIYQTRGNFTAFLKETPLFLEFMKNKEKYRVPIIERAASEFKSQLTGALNFYENIIRAKNDAKRITTEPEFKIVSDLYYLSDPNLSEDFKTLSRFILRYNEEVEALDKTDSKLSSIVAELNKNVPWPKDDYYNSIISEAKEAANSVPESSASNIAKYSRLNCATLLSTRIFDTRKLATSRVSQYEKAGSLVREINRLKPQEEYGKMITSLNQNKDLNFLFDQYPDLDILYIKKESEQIKQNITRNNFGGAENRISGLYTERNFLKPSQIESNKRTSVQNLEEELFKRVLQISTTSVDSFVNRHLNTIDNVEALYRDSSFVPIYNLTFSASGEATVISRRKQISDYLENMKYNNFPERAIRNIYQQFVSNVNNRGVEKARAISVHGRNYKGNDQQIKNIYFECEVTIAKWIVEAKKYRKVFALPITSNINGNNQYMFRLVLKIPSEADFPVFDINIKLPEEIAKNAGTRQWFDVISVNNNPVKIEGRIRVTAPTSSNDYTFQVTPVSMDKGANNVLEVKFTYPAFKVFEVSVMAQEPIIRKN